MDFAEQRAIALRPPDKPAPPPGKLVAPQELVLAQDAHTKEWFAIDRLLCSIAMRLPRPPGDEGWELEVEDASGYAFIASEASSIWLSDVATFRLLECAHDGRRFVLCRGGRRNGSGFQPW